MDKILNIVLALAILGFLGYKFLWQVPKFSNGEEMPNFNAELIDGNSFELKELRGKYVLLDFWGSWCGPCRKDNPNLVKLYDEFKGKAFSDASGFELVSVAIETNKESALSAIKMDGLTWPYHIILLDRFKSAIAKETGVREIPTKYLLSPSGEVISVNESYENLQKFMQNKLK